MRPTSLAIARFASMVLFLLAVPAALAKYDGADPPQCGTCGQVCPACLSNAGISLSEGNLRDSLEGAGLQSSSGDTVRLNFVYNSYDADGSRSTIDTVLGYGWTHSYNVFLFSQRGAMFRMGADGRITLYAAGPGGTYVTSTGYFETLVKNPDGSFTLTQKDQTRYHFQSVPGTPFLVDGPVYMLTSITDRNSNVTTLSYSGGLLSQVADTYGRVLTFSYNSSGHLSKVIDPLGRATNFVYDSTGRQLLTVTDPAGRPTTYVYNSLHQITQKTDRDGRVYKYTYTANLPTAISDSHGSSLYVLPNPVNWAVSATTLTLQMLRSYTPATTTKTDGLSHQWRYSYDANGHITSQQAPDGATTSYTYDPSTLQLSSRTDPDGNKTQYAYDGEGNLLKVTDALGHVTTYTYEPVYNQMTSMTDPNGRETTYKYDGRGNRIGELDPLGDTRSWSYDSHGNVLSETDRRGFATAYQYDGAGNVIQRIDPLNDTTVSTYDAVGNLTSTADPDGNTTTVVYDTLNRPVQRLDALSGVAQTVYDNEGNRITTVDPNHHATQYQYDYRSRMTKMTDALGGITTTVYDANNNRISTTDPDNHTTHSVYDVQNWRIQTIDALGNTTGTAYDPASNIVKETDANGHATVYLYDALNRRIQATDAAGDITRWGYDSTGTSICSQCTGPTLGSNMGTSQTDPDGNVTYYYYDGLDRLAVQNRKVVDHLDQIETGDAVTRYIYDQDSNKISITEPNGNTSTSAYDAVNRLVQSVNAAGDATLTGYDAAGNVIGVTSPNLNVTQYAYDALNRQVQQNDSTGAVNSLTYDPVGNRLTRSDGVGNTTTYGYDALNRMVSVRDALGQTSTYAYDAAGNRLQMTDRLGQTTTYTYDAVNRQTSLTDALINTTAYQYDGVGNIIRVTDARNDVTTFAYDTVNRVVQEQFPGPTPNTLSYSYDAAGNLVGRGDQNGQHTTYSYNNLYFLIQRSYPVSAPDTYTYDLSGRLLSGTKAGWLETYTYDGANRTTQSVQNGQTISYVYDIPGRTRALTYPGGRVITEGYDARNRLAQSNDGGSSAIVSYVYDAADRLLTRNYRNGIAANFVYDADNRVVSIDHVLGASEIIGFHYDRDNEGNALDETKKHAPPLSEAYAYDTTYRLVTYEVGSLVGSTVPVPSTQSQYSLDQVGNWTAKTANGIPQARTHNGVNELTSVAGVPYVYDGNGNQASDSVSKYVYDEENRLTQVSRQSDGFLLGQYQYDAFGRRVRKVDQLGVETRFYYDNWRSIEEQSSTGVTVATYVFGGSADEVATMDRGGQPFYYHQNDLFETHGLTNSAGLLVEGYTYDSYGEQTVYLPGPNGTVDFGGDDVIFPGGESFYGNPFLFTGQRFDPESGLMYYKNRYYSAELGRFLQRDPIGYAGGYDLYEYVRDNPVNIADPNGLQGTAQRKEVRVTCGCSLTCQDCKSGRTTTARYRDEASIGFGTWEPSQAVLPVVGAVTTGSSTSTFGLDLVEEILRSIVTIQAGGLEGPLNLRLNQACGSAIKTLSWPLGSGPCWWTARDAADQLNFTWTNGQFTTRPHSYQAWNVRYGNIWGVSGATNVTGTCTAWLFTDWDPAWNGGSRH